MSRIIINDLEAQEKELTADEMNSVVGGAIRYRRRRQTRIVRGGYRYVSRRVRVRTRTRRMTRINTTASGTNFGRWR